MFPMPAEPFMPHDTPMALIDEILSCNEHRITTRVTLNEKSLFLDAQQRVNASIGIEYMAQSAAAWAGYNARDAQREPSIGMLLGTRDYSSEVAYFQVGDVLTISAECLMQSTEGMGSFECCIEQHGKTVAKARLSVYQPK